MSTPAPAATEPIRVAPDVKAELVRRQQEWTKVHGPGRISLSDVIRLALADRPVKP